MTNSIDLVTRYEPLLDEVFKAAAVTTVLDRETINTDSANIVKIMKVDVTGPGNYSKADGYPKGDTTVEWEDIQLTFGRGRQLSVDRIDDEEALNRAFATAIAKYMRIKVAPETDAIRFARYYAGAGNSASAVLSSSNILAALDAGHEELDTAEAPFEGRMCFVAGKSWRALNAALNRQWANDQSPDRRVFSLDGTTYIPVPQGRFYTAVTLDPGETSSAGGYTKTAVTGRNLNFLLLHPSAVWQAEKFSNMKVFNPDVVQDKDAWLADFRQYHDADVYENKADGIYAHYSTS